MKIKSEIITIGGSALKPSGNMNKADLNINMEMIGHAEKIPNPISFPLLIWQINKLPSSMEILLVITKYLFYWEPNGADVQRPKYISSLHSLYVKPVCIHPVNSKAQPLTTLFN